MNRAIAISINLICCVTTCLTFLLSTPNQTHAAEKVSLQLHWSHQFEFAGFYAALKKGFYAAEGLDVEIRPGGPNVNALNEALVGNADFGVTGSELLLARGKGQPFVAMGVIFQHSAAAILTLQDSKVYTPQDLIGQRLEIGNLSNDAESHAMLLSEGVTHRHFEQVPSTFSVQKLLTKEVSAASVYITNQPYFLEQQDIAYRLMRPSAYGVNFYGDTLFSTEKLLNEKPDVAKAFFRASMNGWRYAFDHPEEIIQLILEEYSDFPFAHSQKHLEYEHRVMRELILPDLIDLGHMNESRWQHMANTFVSLGLLQPDYSLEGFLWQPTDAKLFPPAFLVLPISLAFGSVVAAVLFFRFNRKLEQQKELTQQAIRENAQLQQKTALALWGGNLGYWHWNREKNTLLLDEASAGFLGGQHEARLFTLRDVQADESLDSVRHFFSAFSYQIREQTGAFDIEAELDAKDQQKLWVRCRGEVLKHSDNHGVALAHGVLQDITELKKARQQVEQLTITDSLTGTLNRRYFMGRLSAFIHEVKFDKGHFSVALVNLDRVENLNSEYGEHTGDYVIETLSDMIQQQVRPMDLVARFTGKSFVILLPDTYFQEAQETCEKIRKQIAHHRFDTGNHSFFATVTIGLVETEEFPQSQLNGKQLLHLVEERVKTGKAKGRNLLITKANQSLNSL